MVLTAELVPPIACTPHVISSHKMDGVWAVALMDIVVQTAQKPLPQVRVSIDCKFAYYAKCGRKHPKPKIPKYL